MWWACLKGRPRRLPGLGLAQAALDDVAFLAAAAHLILIVPVHLRQKWVSGVHCTTQPCSRAGFAQDVRQRACSLRCDGRLPMYVFVEIHNLQESCLSSACCTDQTVGGVTGCHQVHVEQEGLIASASRRRGDPAARGRVAVLGAHHEARLLAAPHVCADACMSSIKRMRSPHSHAPGPCPLLALPSCQ